MFVSRRAPARRLAACLLAALLPGAAGAFPVDLFRYRQDIQADMQVFPQWTSVLERQLADNLRDGDCGERRLNRCHMAEWTAFLAGIRGLPARQQLERVNRYANTRDYVLDLDNYGLADYWAIPRQFLPNGGDCEDFAISKLFSLRWLGFPAEDIRIVVVQDTNLRIPHAVLAVASGAEILILDNQVQAVLRDKDIVHYAPVYSINERAWWIHTPARAANP
jgi:predicted transglutaminase-like cysteine proteinase